MAVDTIDYQRNLAVNTDRGPSPSIWGDCPLDFMQEDATRGQHFFDDYPLSGSNPSAAGGAIAGNNGQWSTYVYQAGTVTDGAAEGGVAVLQNTTTQRGIAANLATGAFRITTTSTLALNKKLWFECRVATSTIATAKHDIFVGLFDGFLSSGLPQAAWPITTTTDTLATNMNAIGFQRKASVGTDFTFLYQLTGVATVYPTNLTTLCASVLPAQTLVAATFVKLGFVFDPDAPVTTVGTASTGQTAGTNKQRLITVYVNGLPMAAFLTNTNVAGTSFPTGFMSPGFALMNQTSSTPGTFSIDWIRCAQLANS